MADEQKRDWDRHEWSGEEHPADEKKSQRWDEKEWAGEAPDEPGTEHSEGPSGLSGGGHSAGEQHWTPDKK